MDILHAIFASVAILMGGLQFARRKGDRRHRLSGRVYVAAMVLTALTSFFLTGMTGGFSFLHALSLVTLGTLVYTFLSLRRGEIVAHLYSMTYLYGGLLTAGFFAADRHGLDLPGYAKIAAVVVIWAGVAVLAETGRRAWMSADRSGGVRPRVRSAAR
jgi:uncharacterized membrane protein